MYLNAIKSISNFKLLLQVICGSTYRSQILDALLSKLWSWTYFKVKLFTCSYIQPTKSKQQLLIDLFFFGCIKVSYFAIFLFFSFFCISNFMQIMKSETFSGNKFP